VISPGNSKVEMARKLTDFFAAGARSVWYIYPMTETALVYRDAATFVTLQANDSSTPAPITLTPSCPASP